MGRAKAAFDYTQQREITAAVERVAARVPYDQRPHRKYVGNLPEGIVPQWEFTNGREYPLTPEYRRMAEVVAQEIRFLSPGQKALIRREFAADFLDSMITTGVPRTCSHDLFRHVVGQQNTFDISKANPFAP